MGRNLRGVLGLDRRRLTPAPPRTFVLPLRLLNFQPALLGSSGTRKLNRQAAEKARVRPQSFAARGMAHPLLIESGSTVSALQVDVVEQRKGPGLRVIQVRIVHAGFEPLHKLTVELHELSPFLELHDAHGPTPVVAGVDSLELGAFEDVQPGSTLQWRLRVGTPEDAKPAVWLSATGENGSDSTVLVEL